MNSRTFHHSECQLASINKIIRAVVLVGAGFASLPAQAAIENFSQLKVDFARAPEAVTNATWGGRNIDLTTNGRGSEGAQTLINDFWIQSSPLAVGTCWRPTTQCNVEMKLDFSNSDNPVRAGTPYRQGQWRDPDSAVQFYVRYSPDKVHWSTWQALDNQHRGVITVPDVSRTEYFDLFGEYRKQDVPWVEDEAAAVKWILHRHPDFFEKHLPFVGYVQFRTEGWLRSGQRIKSIQMDVAWVVGGMAYASKKPDEVGKHDGPWQFDAGDRQHGQQ